MDEKLPGLLKNAVGVKRLRPVIRNKKEKPTAPQKLKLLITIVNRSKAEFFIDTLHSFDINLQLAMSARGTANTEALRYLGLGETEKTVIISVIRDEKEKEALDTLSEKFRMIRNGNGIAYTIPLTSTIGVAIYQFLSNNRTIIREEHTSKEKSQ